MLEVGDQVAGYGTITQTDPTSGQPFTFGVLNLVRVESGKGAARWGTFDDPEGKFLEVCRTLLAEQARLQEALTPHLAISARSVAEGVPVSCMFRQT